MATRSLQGAIFEKLCNARHVRDRASLAHAGQHAEPILAKVLLVTSGGRSDPFFAANGSRIPRPRHAPRSRPPPQTCNQVRQRAGKAAAAADATGARASPNGVTEKRLCVWRAAMFRHKHQDNAPSLNMCSLLPQAYNCSKGLADMPCDY